MQCITHPDSKKAMSYTRNQILGRFDVLAIPARMDVDNAWAEYARPQDNTLFFVHHVAALDIGSQHATDISDYRCGQGQPEFFQAKYIRDMHSIFRTTLAAQRFSGVKHAVWFPLGMGAFLRDLPRHDPVYQVAETMAELRRLIARAFFEAVVVELGTSSGIKVHLCLAEGPAGSEADENCLAFLTALQESLPAGYANDVTVWLNTDAAALAQHLANTSATALAVSLTNGANRSLIGNHWFVDGANTAIDENLHRRSLSLALMAFLANGVKVRNAGKTWDSRIRTSEWIQSLGGKHYHVDDAQTPLMVFASSALAPSPSHGPSRPSM